MAARGLVRDTTDKSTVSTHLVEVAFTNGSADQRRVVNDSLGLLLHLDLDRFDFTLTIDFRPNPVSDPNTHHPFAVTESFPDHEETHFRDDFPRFREGGDYGTERFAQETVIHEVGHAILHQLPAAQEAAIVGMFGTTPAEMNPIDRRWEDRPEEGIVETFKDAFLPQGQREFANRTSQKLPIHDYPQFRRRWRDASVVPGTGETEDVVYPSFSGGAGEKPYGLPPSSPLVGDGYPDAAAILSSFGASQTSVPFGPSYASPLDDYRWAGEEFSAESQDNVAVLLDDWRQSHGTLPMDYSALFDGGSTDVGVGSDHVGYEITYFFNHGNTPLPVGSTFVITFDARFRIVWKLAGGFLVSEEATIHKDFTWTVVSNTPGVSDGCGWVVSPSGITGDGGTLDLVIPADAISIRGGLVGIRQKAEVLEGTILWTSSDNGDASCFVELPEVIVPGHPTEPGVPLPPQQDPPAGATAPAGALSGARARRRSLTGVKL